MLRNSLIAIAVLTLAPGLVSLAPAQLGRLPGIGKKDDPKNRQKEVERSQKEAATYDKLKTYSLDKYENDLEFKEDADSHYDNVQREHSQEAFTKNTTPPARIRLVHDGDRARLEAGLYDNKLVQDWITRTGQRMVPDNSEKLFAFRLVAHPVPFAETLSTGTIYLSTGLVALVESEAQLAYILGHEMAHVQKDHWKLKSIMNVGQENFNADQERKRRWLRIGTAAAGAAIGGAAGGNWGGAFAGASIGYAGGAIAGWLFIKGMYLDWDNVQENEADKEAFQAMLTRNYNVEEIPKLYATLEGAVMRDSRIGLGFMGSRRRVQERIANAKDLIKSADLKSRNWVSSGSDYERAVAELKRDNGMLAYYHDMFHMAKSNLDYAAKVRPNDPAAHYYQGKILRVLGRTPEEFQAADQAFAKAAALDTRDRFFGTHLYRAMNMIEGKNPQDPEVVKALQSYLNVHMKVMAEEATISWYLPANLDDVYNYMSDAGDKKWTLKVSDEQLAALTGGLGAVQGQYQPAAASGQSGRGAGGRVSSADGGPTTAQGVAGGAVAGAVVGGVVAGTKGAVVGGAVGATAGGAAASQRKKK